MTSARNKREATPSVEELAETLARCNRFKWNEHLPPTKYEPDCNVVRGEPIIELMRVSREFRMVDMELQAKREKYKFDKDEADREWEDLRQKERLLRESFIKFDEFIQENRGKRKRAARKINHEKELQTIRELEILELKATLTTLEDLLHKMQNAVKKYHPFKEYVEEVVQTSEFASITAMFNRYDTLLDARKYLENEQNESFYILESTGAQLQKMTEEKSQGLMDLNSRLALLQSRLTRARADALHWESTLSHVKKLSGRKKLEDQEVRMCMWNLYRSICKRKDIPMKAKQDDVDQQMHVIKRTIIELRNIVAETKRRAGREKKSVV